MTVFGAEVLFTTQDETRLRDLLKGCLLTKSPDACEAASWICDTRYFSCDSYFSLAVLAGGHVEADVLCFEGHTFICWPWLPYGIEKTEPVASHVLRPISLVLYLQKYSCCSCNRQSCRGVPVTLSCITLWRVSLSCEFMTKVTAKPIQILVKFFLFENKNLK